MIDERLRAGRAVDSSQADARRISNETERKGAFGLSHGVAATAAGSSTPALCRQHHTDLIEKPPARSTRVMARKIRRQLNDRARIGETVEGFGGPRARRAQFGTDDHGLWLRGFQQD